MKPVLVLKTGTTLERLAHRGDYEDWIAAGLGSDVPVEIVPVHRDAAPPEPGEVAGVVVTGSAAMVSHREPWSERAAAWLARAVERGTPVLGICYGHQLLAHALGGRVGPNPRGREMGSVDVHRYPDADGDALLDGLPDPLRAQVTHVESVLELPPAARLLAWSDGDPHQAFAVGERVWGVQFHPEFDAEVMRAYLVERRAILRREGFDADALLADVSETPAGPALLRRFASLLGS